MEGKEREGKGREGKGRKRKEREGQGREGKEREGKERTTLGKSKLACIDVCVEKTELAKNPEAYPKTSANFNLNSL